MLIWVVVYLLNTSKMYFLEVECKSRMARGEILQLRKKNAHIKILMMRKHVNIYE